MAGERRLRILERLAAAEGKGADQAADATTVSTSRLCEVCAEVVRVDGAGLMLMSGDVQRGSICTTDAVSARIEELQYSLGEGPCVDAYRSDLAVREADLAHPAVPRWPAFSPEALAAGVGAVFAFPLRVGSVRLGALDLYNADPGPLDDEQHADALVMADIAAEAVLVMQAQALPGRVAAALEANAEFHFVVHQAAGMVAAQLGTSIAHAMVRLRAHAFGNERSLREVAADVVSRTLRFDTLDESDPDQGAGPRP